MNAGAAQRIDPQAELRAADGVHVNHIAQIGNVAAEEVEAARGGGVERPGKGNALDACEAGLKKLLALLLDPAGGHRVRRAAVGRRYI